ncbi:MAG TPA: hypothetical protein VML96_02875 [Egibacteraceae bacterium]|nr:hypothetical protein [Egibacteraceae bacterium]
MPPPDDPRDPWRGAPVGELSEQLLPRWFAILAVAMVPLALAAVVAALIVGGAAEVPLSQRRPPPAGDLTADVGALDAGGASPVPYEGACSTLHGVQVAGSPADQATLRQGLAALCNTEVDDALRRRLSAFAQAGGIVRFARFERTGVDSTADLSGAAPMIYLNARFSRTDPLWIAPIVAHDVTFTELDPSAAASALAAREAEHLVCQRLLGERRRSRACEDAAGLLALDDPLAALREAGFQ